MLLTSEVQAFDREIEGNDSFFTLPMARFSVPAIDFPVIPPLAEQILLATESMQAREAVGKPKPRDRKLNMERACPPGTLPYVLYHKLLATPAGLEGGDLFQWLVSAYMDKQYSRSKMQGSILRLEALGLVTSRRGTRNRRHFTAVAPQAVTVA